MSYKVIRNVFQSFVCLAVFIFGHLEAVWSHDQNKQLVYYCKTESSNPIYFDFTVDKIYELHLQ